MLPSVSSIIGVVELLLRCSCAFSLFFIPCYRLVVLMLACGTASRLLHPTICAWLVSRYRCLNKFQVVVLPPPLQLQRLGQLVTFMMMIHSPVHLGKFKCLFISCTYPVHILYISCNRLQWYHHNTEGSCGQILAMVKGRI